MKNIFIIIIALLNLDANGCNPFNQKRNGSETSAPGVEVKLLEPVYKSGISIEEALLNRRSVRSYKNEALELKDVSQLLWAAQGITSKQKGGRTAPSAGALYPLEIFVACGDIKNIAAGVYHYQPAGHLLQLITEGDKRNLLSAAAHLQASLSRSAAVIIIAADYSRTTKKYEGKGRRYVDMEAGHAAQNICLQAVSLNIGTVTMGSFNDSKVKQLLNLPAELEPLYLLPIGRKKD
jgi:SagB-type dehydrogenase family enzyme